MSGQGKGCCMNLFIGIVGSYAGALICGLLDIQLIGRGYLFNFIFCVIGSLKRVMDMEQAFSLILIVNLY